MNAALHNLGAHAHSLFTGIGMGWVQEKSPATQALYELIKRRAIAVSAWSQLRT